MLKIVVILDCVVFPNKKWIEEWLLQPTRGKKWYMMLRKGYWFWLVLRILCEYWRAVYGQMAFVCSTTMFLPITVLIKDFVLTNTTSKSKNYISYLHSKTIALDVFVLFRAKFCLCALPHFYACAKVLGFACLFVPSFMLYRVNYSEFEVCSPFWERFNLRRLFYLWCWMQVTVWMKTVLMQQQLVIC